MNPPLGAFAPSREDLFPPTKARWPDTKSELLEVYTHPSREEREQRAGMGERYETRGPSPRSGPVSARLIALQAFPRGRDGARGFCMVRFMVRLRVQTHLEVRTIHEAPTTKGVSWRKVNMNLDRLLRHEKVVRFWCLSCVSWFMESCPRPNVR